MLPSLLLDFGDRRIETILRLLGEGADADIADILVFGVRLDRAHADDVADDLDVERFLAFAQDGQRDRRIDLAAHLVDGLVEGETLDLLAIKLGDEIVGHDAGPGGGRFVDRRHHLDDAVFHGHFDAQPAEFAAGLHLHVLEALGGHVARMRIERGQHAVDRRFDQLLFFRHFDIVRPDAIEHVAEEIKLLVSVRVRRRGGRVESLPGDRRHQGSGEHQSD